MTRKHLGVFRELLSSADMDVRIEAGENLALLHESRIILGLSDRADRGVEEEEGRKEDGDDEEKVEDDYDEEEEEEAIDLTVIWEEVVDEMKGFITESSKKVCA